MTITQLPRVCASWLGAPCPRAPSRIHHHHCCHAARNPPTHAPCTESRACGIAAPLLLVTSRVCRGRPCVYLFCHPVPHRHSSSHILHVLPHQCSEATDEHPLTHAAMATSHHSDAAVPAAAAALSCARSTSGGVHPKCRHASFTSPGSSLSSRRIPDWNTR